MMSELRAKKGELICTNGKISTELPRRNSKIEDNKIIFMLHIDVINNIKSTNPFGFNGRKKEN